VSCFYRDGARTLTVVERTAEGDQTDLSVCIEKRVGGDGRRSVRRSHEVNWRGEGGHVGAAKAM
jgi:hypothetical protein